jgi:hypothetical protein
MSEGKPVHVRELKTEAFLEGTDQLRLRGHLRDERPFGLGGKGGEAEHIHHLILELVVRIPDFTILSATAEMPTVPQPECREVAAGVKQLEGLSITSGFSKKVRELFPRVLTCPHLTALILAVAPVAMQGAFVQFIGQAGEKLVAGGPEAAALMEASFSWWKNTCYVAAEDGPVVEQIKARGMLYSLQEVAAILNVAYPDLLRKAQEGEFPAFEQEGKWVVRWQDLEPWFKARQAGQVANLSPGEKR